ncbi:LOW QUALITY PROTEIN: putative E3 ubiquitin-protein ligase MARCHF10 [Cariama cristata]
MVTAVQLQRRESKDSDKLYPPDGNSLEDADHSELEDRPNSSSPSLFQTRFTPDLHIACVLHEQLPLLPEDSEEEGDQCRNCQIAGGSPTNLLLEPCGYVGSLQFVHQECLKQWLKPKIKSGADLEAVKTCELCKQKLITDVDNFNVNAHYRHHRQSRLVPMLTKRMSTSNVEEEPEALFHARVSVGANSKGSLDLWGSRLHFFLLKI